VTALCHTGIWMQQGRLIKSGPARTIVDEYLTTNASSQTATMDLGNLRRAGEYGRKFKIEKLEWLSGLPLQHGEPISARIYFQAMDDVEDIAVGLGFSTLEGVRLLTVETDFPNGRRPVLKKNSSGHVDLVFGELPLAPGIYSLDIGARSGDSFGLDFLPGFTQSEITMGLKTPGYIARQGAGVRLTCDWNWNVGGPAAAVKT
jgi:hypothetical protein